jgi:2-methylisocitrate lyase-like PEP mutase family enzyme
MNSSIIPSQAVRAEAFKLLHERPGIFVIPNPWDAGSARMLARLGFKALATTSAGLAFSLGKPDGNGTVTREEALANAQEIISATELLVSADLENGYGDDPETCAETILLAAGAGLSGGSIEDATGREEDPIYPFELSVERIKAAVKAAQSLPIPFMLTARAENLIHGRPDLNDTIRRLVAYAEAGADVLFAPGLQAKEDIAAVVKAIAPCPLSLVIGQGQAAIRWKNWQILA